MNQLEPDKFFEKVQRPPNDDHCFIWVGTKTTDGYGQMYFRDMKMNRDRSLYAHRVSYMLHKGEIPPGKVIRHLCNNRLCVNPKHLLVGTHQDNVRDRCKSGRSARGEGNGRSRLSVYEILSIRNLYSSGTFTYKSLSKLFGVDASTIGLIVRGDRWKHVGGPVSNQHQPRQS